MMSRIDGADSESRGVLIAGKAMRCLIPDGHGINRCMEIFALVLWGSNFWRIGYVA